MLFLLEDVGTWGWREFMAGNCRLVKMPFLRPRVSA